MVSLDYFFSIVNGHRKKQKAKGIPVVSSKNVLHFCSSGTLFHILEKVSVHYDHIGLVFKGDIQHFLFCNRRFGCLSGIIIQKLAHSHTKSQSVLVHVHLLCPLSPAPLPHLLPLQSAVSY